MLSLVEQAFEGGGGGDEKRALLKMPALEANDERKVMLGLKPGQTTILDHAS